MATLVLRTVKGAPLTNLELDNNFSNINIELGNVAAVVGSNIGDLNDLQTSVKSNLVAAINELQANVSVGSIVSGNTSFSIPVANGSIIANINNTSVFVINATGSVANVEVNGNLTATLTKTATLQDGSGRTLRILNESNAVIWGS